MSLTAFVESSSPFSDEIHEKKGSPIQKIRRNLFIDMKMIFPL